MVEPKAGGVPPCLEARALECIRGNRVLFRDLELRVQAGQVVQVAGANGSGKTSLLRLLCGLGVPTGGSIRWGGEEIDKIRSDYLSRVTYVGHLPGIKLDLTPGENLNMDRALNRSTANTEPRQILERLGLWSFRTTPCRHLSAGQKRRVALARLLIRHSALWFLDEPFTAIDQNGIGDLVRVISDFVRTGGMVVMTSHQTVQFEGCELHTLRLGR
jgi:heme exporter protein A